jgi:adenylyl cyclase-associated protein
MSLDSAVSALLSRLEAVTKRLEQVEGQLASGAVPTAVGAPSSAAASAAGGADAPYVEAYQRLIDDHIAPYVAASKKIGGEVATQADLVFEAVNAQKAFLAVASQSKKPDQATLQKLIEGTAQKMGAVGEIREKNRASKLFGNLSAISEGISALGWVVVEPTPGPHVKEARGSSEFYSNKLLTAHKNKDSDEDKNQVTWVASWNGFLKDLEPYVKQFHTTGVAWNPRGGDAAAAKPAAAAPAAAPKAAAPAATPAAAPKRGGLLSEINAVGDGKKPALNKVTKEMKIKGQEGKSSLVKAAEPKATAAKPTQPAKLQLNGNKWEIEYQVNNPSLVLDQTEPKQGVYLYKCERSTIVVKGKINNITLDSCKRVSVVFETCIASVEAVNSQSLEIQCLGTCPTFTVDATSGFQLFLSKDAVGTQITQSKSSEINISIPGAAEHDDPIELNVPDQFITTIVDKKLVTKEVVHV